MVFGRPVVKGGVYVPERVARSDSVSGSVSVGISALSVDTGRVHGHEIFLQRYGMSKQDAYYIKKIQKKLL